MKRSAIILIALLLAACAEMDPYLRVEHVTKTPDYRPTDEEVVHAFSSRWPEQFKCVQTVTIDFGVQTRTLVGYLIVQRPDRFRLQGMSEQGLKLFDIVVVDEVVRSVFAAEEFDERVVENIARDIHRTFLYDAAMATNSLRPRSDFRGLWVYDTSVRTSDLGVRATLEGMFGSIEMSAMSEPPLVDWYDYRQSDRSLYRVDHYDWQRFGDHFLPGVIVLRERGIQSDGPSYKLTIKITEVTVRDTPWPEKIFQPEGE